MALPSSSRNGAPVLWVCLHTAEGSRNKESLYTFFNRNQNASSHVGIDGKGIADWVPRDRSAWTLRNGSKNSVNAELCGFAKWSREQWLSEGVVDGVVNPRNMVRNAAIWAKRECQALGIPARYVGTNGVRNRERGIIVHWDYTKGTGDGTHWDTGHNFPWDVFFADMGVAHTPTPSPAPAPPSGGGAPPWPLPRDHYFGDIKGPAKSHGGYHANERPHIKLIQQALIRKGFVPGVNNPNGGWADGIYEQPTVDAVARFQRAHMPGTTFYGQVWWDDWAKLLG